jgi:1-acylglycerone phosphate reductase
MVFAFTPLLIAASASASAQTSLPPPAIINTASILARIPLPFSAAYNASKAAVASYSDTLRIELEPLGIKVVTLFMGEVRTKLMAPDDTVFSSESIYRDLSEKVKEKSRNHGRDSMGPEEFAAAAVKEILLKSLGSGKGEYLWKGMNAWLIWFLDIVGWRNVFDGFVKKMVGLDQRDNREAIARKVRAGVS